jgi:iron-sulfur cluster assembly protein
MITLTPAAAAQIRRSAEQSGAGLAPLRLAARREADGSFQYGMGFDEAREDDIRIHSEGVELLIAPSSKDLLAGSTLDFVELNPGEQHFIFINPNDPTHRATSKPA